MRIASTSTEYVRIQVTATEAGDAVDPTALPVDIAFTDGTVPDTGDWETAEWETDGTDYYARLLVGPDGDVTLTAGARYAAWVRITDSTEIPVLLAPRVIRVL